VNQSPYQPPTLAYRPPGPEPRSQWWTDEDAYAGCMIYGLMGLTVLGAVIGGVWWLVSSILGN
jgi:hypothetical protein